MSTKSYASVSWTIEDVQTLRPDFTDEQAEKFLQDNERHLRDRLIEHGWDVMSDLLAIDGK